jgi:hypothetical protein
MKNKSQLKTISNEALCTVAGGAQDAGIKAAVDQLKLDAKARNRDAIKTDAAAIKTAAQAFAATKKGGGKAVV